MHLSIDFNSPVLRFSSFHVHFLTLKTLQSTIILILSKFYYFPFNLLTKPNLAITLTEFTLASPYKHLLSLILHSFTLFNHIFTYSKISRCKHQRARNSSLLILFTTVFIKNLFLKLLTKK